MPTFRTTLHGVEDMNATGIEVPASIIEGLNSGKRPKVVITINGASWRTTVAVMGGGYVVGVPAEQRSRCGIKAGDAIEVTLELDTAPREVETPSDLADALAAQNLRETWDRLAFTHKKEHVRSIEEAKAPETRQRRIEKAVAFVASKQR